MRGKILRREEKENREVGEKREGVKGKGERKDGRTFRQVNNSQKERVKKNGGR